MKKTAYQKSFLLGFAVIMVISLLGGNASGADEVTIKTYFGPFNPFFRKGKWTTRMLEISNTTQEDRLCDLGCITSDPDKGGLQFYRQVLIPSNSKRIAKVVYRPENLSALQERKDSGMQSFEQVYKLWDSKTGQLLDTKTANVLDISDNFKVLGIINISRLEHDTNTYIKDNPALLGKTRLVRGGRGKALPNRWYEYSMLNLLAMGEIEHDTLNISQVDAILHWVRRGGTLLLTGHEKMTRILQNRIGKNAGVKCVGFHWIDKLRTNDVNKEKTVEVVLDWPMPFAELYTTGAKVLFKANGLPLLTTRQFGQGRIMTLAVPFAAAKPEKGYNIWHKIRQAINTLPAIQADNFFDPANVTLQEIAGRPGPTGIVPAGILLGLMGFVVIAGYLLRFRRKGEIVWMILLPVSIALAIGLYVYSRTVTNPQRLSNIGLITSLGDGQVRVQQAFAYYSGPENQEPTFSANSLNGLIFDTGRAATAALEISKIETTDFSVVLPKQKVRPNATRRFYVDTIVKTAGIEPNFSFNSKGAFGTITNNTGMLINDAVLMINYKTYRIGSIKEQGDTSVQITPTDFLGNIEFKKITSRRTGPRPKVRRRPTKNPPSPKSKTKKSTIKRVKTITKTKVSGEFTIGLTPDQRRNNLLRKLLAVPGTSRTITDTPLLIGYTANSIVDPLPDRTLPREGWSVITWPITLRAPQPGTEVLIPAGFVDKQFENLKSKVWNPRTMEFFDSPRPSELIIMARPPWKNGKLKNATAIITFKIRATGYNLTASGVKLGNKTNGRKIVVASRTLIETFSNPTGTFEVTIKQADRFLDKSGWLVFSLDVKSTSKTTPPPIKGTKTPNNKDRTTVTWKFNSVDVVLKGYAS